MRRLAWCAVVFVAVLSSDLMALQSRTIPSRLYQPDVRIFDIPPSAQRKFVGMALSLSRENWPLGENYTLSDGTVVTNTAVAVLFQRTPDNGQTWLDAGGATFSGGIIVRTNGQVLTHSQVSFAWTDPATGLPIAQDGDLRIVIQNLVTLRTEVALTMTELGDL